MILEPNQRPQFNAQDRDLLEHAAGSAAPLDLQKLCSSWKKAGLPDLDLATALLYDRILRRAQNHAFLESVCNGPGESARESVAFGIVPGAFYREHHNTGADGGRIVAILRGLGLTSELIPVHSFGRLEENARIINDWLRAQQAERVALVTLSKGGADCKVALRLGAAAEWKRVTAWVSFSGLVQGTPLIAWLRRQPLRMIGVRLLLWLRRQRFAAADDLRHGEGEPLASWPAVPPTLRLVHVMAFPLRRHLRHPWAFRAYQRLAGVGPNDGGGILLEDAARLPGIVCPVWGVDHYLEPDWDCAPLLRNIVLASLAPGLELRHATQSAATPRAAPAARSTK